MSDNHPRGYSAPGRGERPGPAVLVLHPWWGLNETIRAFCDRLSKEGFTVFAPDLYHGKTAKTVAEAEALAGELDGRHLEAKAEVAAAARYVAGLGADPGRAAVVGFSLGAYYALHLSTELPELIDTVVTFYGSGGADFSKSKARYLAHYAGNDPYEPQENIDYVRGALKDAGRPLTLYQYPGTGHWFFEPDITDAYNAAAADLAWKRTLDFLGK